MADFVDDKAYGFIIAGAAVMGLRYGHHWNIMGRTVIANVTSKVADRLSFAVGMWLYLAGVFLIMNGYQDHEQTKPWIKWVTLFVGGIGLTTQHNNLSEMVAEKGDTGKHFGFTAMIHALTFAAIFAQSAAYREEAYMAVGFVSAALMYFGIIWYWLMQYKEGSGGTDEASSTIAHYASTVVVMLALVLNGLTWSRLPVAYT